MRNALVGVVVGLVLGIVGASWATTPTAEEYAATLEALKAAIDAPQPEPTPEEIADTREKLAAIREQAARAAAERELAGGRRDRFEYCSIVLDGAEVESTCAGVDPAGDVQGGPIHMAGRRGWQLMAVPMVDRGWLWTTREFWFERERVVP